MHDCTGISVFAEFPSREIRPILRIFRSGNCGAEKIFWRVKSVNQTFQSTNVRTSQQTPTLTLLLRFGKKKVQQ